MYKKQIHTFLIYFFLIYLSSFDNDSRKWLAIRQGIFARINFWVIETFSHSLSGDSSFDKDLVMLRDKSTLHPPITRREEILTFKEAKYPKNVSENINLPATIFVTKLIKLKFEPRQMNPLYKLRSKYFFILPHYLPLNIYSEHIKFLNVWKPLLPCNAGETFSN